MRACERCGAGDHLPQARFCMTCGGPLGEEEAPEQLRKTVTILFSDLVDSTVLGERLDPEAVADLLTTYFTAMRAIVDRHEGVVAKYLGDAVMAVFGIPCTHEDDALRAVRAAAEMRQALGSLNSEFVRRWGVSIATRTGINTGVVASVGAVPDQDFVAGDASNVAARLEQLAERGEILMAESTYRLVRDRVEAHALAPVALKGKAAPTTPYRLVRVLAAHEHAGLLPGSRMVGRRSELDALDWALRRCIEDRTGRLVTILGTAGVGKSRLVDEFVHEIADECTVLRGRCLPYGDGTMFRPLLEIVRQAAGIEDEDPDELALSKLAARLPPSPSTRGVTEKLAQVAGLAPAGAAAESPGFAMARLLHGIAGERPVIAIFDDLHWAEPTLLGLVEQLVRDVSGVPVVILAVARPELIETSPAWGATVLATRLELAALNEAECDRMVAMLLGGSSGPRGVRDRIEAAAAGNPLYAEQMVSMLLDEGQLVRTDAGLISTGDVSEIAVPPGVQALLSGRLERLGRDERSVVGAASVIGMVFYCDAIHALVPELSPDRVSALLHALFRKDLVRPARSDMPGQDGFAFLHQVIRDVAYERLSKSQRAVLHERFADWFETAMGEQAAEHGDVLGHHLEQAYRYRAELGPVDDQGLALAGRAAEWLARAGWRSSALGDTSAGVALRRRALALMDPAAPRRVQVLAELGDALMWRGEFDEAAQALAEAAASTAEADARPRMLARLSQLRLAFQIDPDADYEALEREALTAVEAFEAAGDDFGAARAWRVVYWVRWGMCRLALMRPAAERGYEHDRHARDPHYPQDDLVGVLVSIVWGPMPASEALVEGSRILEQLRGHGGAEANATCFLGQLRAMLGQEDAAREMIEQGVAAREMLGDIPGAAMSRAEGLGYFVAMLNGDWDVAERELRRGYDALRVMGDKNYLAVTAGWLAHALLALGRDDEAEDLVATARASAARDWVAAQVLWRGAEAVILARRGRLPEGLALAREAVALALATDRTDTQTDALLDLVEVLRLGGRLDEAAEVAEDALRRYERKEVVPGVLRVRALLVELRGADGFETGTLTGTPTGTPLPAEAAGR